MVHQSIIRLTKRIITHSYTFSSTISIILRCVGNNSSAHLSRDIKIGFMYIQ
jgi:hypothetical protein